MFRVYVQDACSEYSYHPVSGVPELCTVVAIIELLMTCSDTEINFIHVKMSYLVM